MLRLEDGDWQSSSLVADYLWATCAQAVQQLCKDLVQLSKLMRSTTKLVVAVWVNSRVINKLYYFCTHHLNTYFKDYSSLLNQTLYTLSTQPIKRTTN